MSSSLAWNLQRGPTTVFLPCVPSDASRGHHSMRAISARPGGRRGGELRRSRSKYTCISPRCFLPQFLVPYQQSVQLACAPSTLYSCLLACIAQVVISKSVNSRYCVIHGILRCVGFDRCTFAFKSAGHKTDRGNSDRFSVMLRMLQHTHACHSFTWSLALALVFRRRVRVCE